MEQDRDLIVAKKASDLFFSRASMASFPSGF
jgi:hypothetical protein